MAASPRLYSWKLPACHEGSPYSPYAPLHHWTQIRTRIPPCVVSVDQVCLCWIFLLASSVVNKKRVPTRAFRGATLRLRAALTYRIDLHFPRIKKLGFCTSSRHATPWKETPDLENVRNAHTHVTNRWREPRRASGFVAVLSRQLALAVHSPGKQKAASYSSSLSRFLSCLSTRISPKVAKPQASLVLSATNRYSTHATLLLRTATTRTETVTEWSQASRLWPVRRKHAGLHPWTPKRLHQVCFFFVKKKKLCTLDGYGREPSRRDQKMELIHRTNHRGCSIAAIYPDPFLEIPNATMRHTVHLLFRQKLCVPGTGWNGRVKALRPHPTTQAKTLSTLL